MANPCFPLPDEDEILIVTHNSGSVFKETLTHLPAGSKIGDELAGVIFIC